jgi:hypothetical protein
LKTPLHLEWLCLTVYFQTRQTASTQMSTQISASRMRHASPKGTACEERGTVPISGAPASNPAHSDVSAVLALFREGLREFEEKGLAGLIKEIPPTQDHSSWKLRFLVDIGEQIDRGHKRKVLRDALRLRRRWRLADVAQLEAMDLRPAAQRLVDKLKHSGKLGRGVIRDTRDRTKQLARQLRSQLARADPATPPEVRRNLYKKTRRFEEYIEPAYRGELALAQQRALKDSFPHERACELAEAAVAKAAGISQAQVRKYCHSVRSGRRGKPAPDDEPPTSAAELKRYLEYGPDLGSFSADLKRGT